MATVNFINRKKSQNRAGMSAVLNYTMQDSKTAFEDMKLVSGMNCTPQSVYHEFINTKLLYGKDDGRMYYHFVQSFHKDEVISPTTAHEIALKLAEYYTGFEVLVATHTDREHIHSHFIVNSVNFETGKKLHQSAKAIPEIRQKSDQLCMQYGLSICEPKQDRSKVKSMTIGEYHMALKGKNWKLQLANIIDECMKYADSRETFISLMESEGIKVKWTDSRKNITYELADGKRCRDNKLYEEKYLKERLEKELAIRQKIIYGRAETTEQTSVYIDTDDSRRYAVVTDEPRRTAENDEHAFEQPRNVLQRAVTDETEHKQDSDTTGFAEDTITADGDEQDLVTGWETERAFFFSAEIQATEHRMDTDTGVYDIDLANIGSDILRIGNAMERMAEPTRIVDSTTQIVTKERKKGIGQKEDDEESQEYKFTHQMY